MSNPRRERFLTWYAATYGDGQDRSRFIERTRDAEGKTLTKGRVSQLFDPREPFGERAAAALAERLGLPVGAFETDDGLQRALSGPKASAPAAPAPRVAHSMSLYEITVPPTTEWEELMTLGEVPERFTVAMPDDALAGFIERGTGLIFERSDRAAPGKTVLVEDKDGNRFIRRYAQVRGDHWRAIATSEVFASLDSLEHGLRVLAVMRWREG